MDCYCCEEEITDRILGYPVTVGHRMMFGMFVPVASEIREGRLVPDEAGTPLMLCDSCTVEAIRGFCESSVRDVSKKNDDEDSEGYL